MKRIFVIILIVILTILFIRILSQEDDWICVDNDWIKHGVPSAPKPTEPCGTIDSFEECATAGFPIMESYPRQCRDAEENLFVEVSLEGRVNCTDESRNVDACIAIYQPVCGKPINQTFSNSCFACINENVIYYTEGECS
jgi:hypothetical protein